MTAWVFEARYCPNEIKKTKLYTYTSPAAGINFLLPAGRSQSLVPSLINVLVFEL